MQKKNSPMLRLMSMLEAIAITATLIIGLSVPAFSAEIDDSLPKEFKELEEIPFEMPMEEGDLSLEELRYAELSESELPAVIDKQSADEMRHVKRLTAQEPDDYTVVFQNRDASKTVYIYSSPVKDEERDLSADEVNHLNDNAFSFESGCFFINSKNAITERLAKGSEREIRDYAVGCASIVTDSGIIIDITERLRNIAGTETGIQSGIELGEDEREALIENEGLVYLTLTYSDISGVFSIKNNYDNKHLTFLYPNNRLYTNSTLLSIAGQWIFGYHSSGYSSYYDIRPVGKQWYYLGYNSSYTTVIAGDYQAVPQGNRYWTLDIVGEDNIYFHTKADDSYILNNTLGVETVNSDYASFPIVSYAEHESSITDEEANDLILDAFYLDCFINKLSTRGTFYYRPRKIGDRLSQVKYTQELKLDAARGTSTLTYKGKSAEIIEIAKSVYSDEIASHIVDGWEKDNSKKAPIFCNDINEYNEYKSSYGFSAFLYPLIYDADIYMYDILSRNLGNFFNNEYIVWEYNDNGKAYGKVKMTVEEMIPDRYTDLYSRPVYVSVSFSKQEDGWRIDGGEFVNAMTNVYATKFEDVCDLKHAVPLLGWWIDKELSEHGFEHWWREDEFEAMGAVEPNPMPALKEIKAVSIEKDSVELICRVRITNSKFQVLCAGEFSAVFKIVHAAKDDPEYIDLPGASYDEFSGVWFVLSDGGMYELLVKNNMRPLQYNGEPSPYTGDGDNVKQTIIFTSAAIAAACACLCVIRKRKENE